MYRTYGKKKIIKFKLKNDLIDLISNDFYIVAKEGNIISKPIIHKLNRFEKLILINLSENEKEILTDLNFSNFLNNYKKSRNMNFSSENEDETGLMNLGLIKEDEFYEIDNINEKKINMKNIYLFIITFTMSLCFLFPFFYYLFYKQNSWGTIITLFMFIINTFIYMSNSINLFGSDFVWVG